MNKCVVFSKEEYNWIIASLRRCNEDLEAQMEAGCSYYMSRAHSHLEEAIKILKGEEEQ